MKLKLIAPMTAIVVLASPLLADDKPAAKSDKVTMPEKVSATSLTNEIDKVSYALGMNYGGSMKMAPVELKLDLILAGLRDAAVGKAALSDKEKEDTLSKFEKQMTERDARESKEKSEKNKKDGIAFLAENKKKEGVKVTPSGLQYKIITDGTGPSPKATDSVQIHYRGSSIEGQEFDSSYKRKIPNIVPLNAVIRGWSEALQMMKVGSKWQLFIPPDLAYGIHGAGREVP